MEGFCEDVKRFLRTLDFSGNGKNLKPYFIFLISLSVFGSALTVAQPFLFMKLIDNIIGSNDGMLELSTEVIIIIYGLCFLSVRVIDELWKAFFTEFTLAAQRNIAEKAFDHIIRLPSTFFLSREKHALPEIISRARLAVHEVISVSLETIIPVALEILLVSCIVYFIFPWTVLIMLLISVALFVAIAIIGSEKIRPWQRAFTEENNKTHQVLGEILSSEETVKSFNVEDEFKKRYLSHMSIFESYCYKFFKWSAFIGSLQMLAVGGALIPILLISYNLFQVGTISLGAFVMVNVLTVQLIMPLRRLAFAYRQVKESAVDIEQLDKVMLTPSETDRSVNNAEDIILESAEISFKNVCFSYEEGGNIILDNV